MPAVQDEGREEADITKSTTVRLKSYTGIELKTLWNHFNKDGVMTLSELNGLLERVLLKDSNDMFNDLKRTKGWLKFCKSALKVLDTSQGSSVDLAEFTSEFNIFNSNRFYYAVKYLLPEMLSLLRSYSATMGVNADRLGEFTLGTPADDGKSKEIISALESKVRQMEIELDQQAKKESLDSNALSSQLDLVQKRAETAEARVVQLEDELSRLKISISESVLNEWEEKFNKVIQENSELRNTLDQARLELITQSEQLESAKQNSGQPSFSATAFGASLTDVELDPFRTQLVRQYGSFDEVMKNYRLISPKKITMVEMETMCLSLNYTREYCRKLFYALDTRNRGYLTLDQFSRPLPILNKELCLLLKKE
jgi:hypothetical protein